MLAGCPNLAAVAEGLPNCQELHFDYRFEHLAPSRSRFRPRLSLRRLLRRLLRPVHPMDYCLLWLPVPALLFPEQEENSIHPDWHHPSCPEHL